MASPTPPWYGPDGIPGTDDDWTAEQIATHLARQNLDDFDHVVLADGTVRPLGGRTDRQDGDDS